MQIIKSSKELHSQMLQYREEGKTIGFVPTMGALHEGHISLVSQCRSENDVVVVSIFVNPTQFNDPKDLERYPRTLEADTAMLEKAKCDIIFHPEVNEMYPEKDTRVFEFGQLDKVMEGKHRPGHFNGVAQVVTKLFDIVVPHKAYFGEKDFQQLAIIQYFVKQLKYDIQIIPCPIVREPDGLAMSSRNKLLTPEHRAAAPLISKIIFESKKLKGSKKVDELKQWVIGQINNNELLKVEYFELSDRYTLQPIKNWEDSKDVVGCIAVFAGKIRLIDNVLY
ncbi:MAG TPA: pantoate--beta-alanine ligase [Bacteroidales bacterium]|nr:pantoate--beta-alanine ligase [Bacteroidales bacterium]